MSACERCQNQMAEALYGELEGAARGEFDAHLAACESCAALYGELRATVDTMNRRRRPDPGADFWSGYTRRLEERMAEEETAADASRLGRRPFGSWGYRVAAAVIVLAAGVWIGRTVLAPSPRVQPVPGEVVAQNPGTGTDTPGSAPQDHPGDVAATHPQPIDAPAGEAVKSPAQTASSSPQAGTMAAVNASDDALRYIGRTQVVLLALINGADNDGVAGDYSSERKQARVLVAEGQKLHDQLKRPQDRRLRELVGQLDLILREIANLEAESDLDAVEMIRNRVDREGVLLRIDMQQLQDINANDGRGNNSSEKSGAFD